MCVLGKQSTISCHPPPSTQPDCFHLSHLFLVTSLLVIAIVYCSSNGTFVNGEKVGKNRKVPLNNNDEISLALPKNRGS